VLAYDPDRPPRPDAWLATDEGERLELAAAYHRAAKQPLPNARLHAAIHVVVENQVAMGETTVVETLERLRGEGLSRHNAIHAIGSVLAERLVAAMRGELTSDTLTPEYLKGLRSLTAEGWKSS
jgi:Domain of unknown function (DUF1841)